VAASLGNPYVIPRRADEKTSLSIDGTDVENEVERERFIRQVLEAGNEAVRAEREEMIRKGIIDSAGNPLKTELP
jgi:phosphosulfolactate synthase (CoM biosynthesis protein A)